MGLIDKLKNLFMDEIEVEDTEEIEEIQEKKEKKEKKDKKEKKQPLPTIMKTDFEIEDKKPEFELTREIIHSSELKQEKKEANPEFKFPFVFDDADFEEPKQPVVKEPVPSIEPKRKENLYNATKKEKQKETKKFTPTPIISPVFGVLDKNYKKDEVKSKPEHSQKIKRSSNKKADFETVRMKAFGSLTDEINENLLQEIENDDKVEVIDSNNLLYEITTDKDTTIGTAEDNYYDFGVSYEVPREEVKVPDDEVKIVNHNEDKEVKADKIEVKEKKKKEQSTVVEDANETDLELTEDLFSLIDSMYDERNDE